MKVVNHFPRRTYLPYYFCVAIALGLVGACSTKKVPKVVQPSLPTSKPVQTNGSNVSQPHSSASNKVPIGYSGSNKEDQPSIISRLDRHVQEEKACCEAFSQKLSTITDRSERDKMIGSFVEARKLRIEAFNQDLKTVVDANEKQRLIREFHGTEEMCEEVNALNNQYRGTLDPTKQREKFQKLGDIVEKYNGYEIESKRSQIRSRVEKLMEFAADHPSIFPNKQGQPAPCAICHATGSVGLLPCGDYLHAGCLVEAMIDQFRMGHQYWVLACPGSCGNCLHFSYFLSNYAYAKEYLSLDKWKEVFFKSKGR